MSANESSAPSLEPILTQLESISHQLLQLAGHIRTVNFAEYSSVCLELSKIDGIINTMGKVRYEH